MSGNNKIGKIWIVLFSVFVSFGLTVNITALENNTSEADENESDMIFPVMTDFPPKTEEMLAMINPNPQPTMSFDDLPNQFSWKSYGGDWTTPARNQGNCGSCWAFAALSTMEASINIASGSPSTDVDLSEQYVLSCLGAAGDCDGGWMSTAIAYIQSTSPGSAGNGINGVCIESCMPYQAVDYIPCDNKCEDWNTFSEPPQSSDKLFQIESYGVTTTSEDNPSDWILLKTWIMTYGPLSVDINFDGFSSWGYSHHSPIDVYEDDINGWTNHGVLLVGWVDDPNILNGGYWIIKNSWGSGWGYSGFGNIAYGCNGVATRDCTWVLTPSWPSGGGNNGGPIDFDAAVFANFEYETDEGIQYPHVGEEIEFFDTSDGDVSSREWDFNGDGAVDSTNKRPTWTYNQEGDYEVTLTVRNEWGIESNRTRVVSVKEVWPPVAKITPSSYADNELEVAFVGRYSYDVDGGTIVSYHWDFDDGSTSDDSNQVHTFAEPDKIYNVTLTVTDNDGGSSTATCVVAIDQTVPPETSILHGFGNDGPKWYGATERISFYATDWTEVIDTFYRVDNEGGNWIRYVPEEQRYIPVAGEGLHTVECYSVDYYHNEEAVVSETFGIDKTPPSLDVSVSGEEQNGWYTSAIVSMSGDDALSGFEKIIYSLDGRAWKDYSGSFSVGEGSHYLSVVGVDVAGNTVEESLDVNVDTGSPSSNVVFDGEGSDYMFYKTVDLRIVASDLGAGVETVYYRLEALGGFTEYDSAITVEDVGDHEVEFYAVDKLGNEEEHQTQGFTVSPVNFEMSLDQPSDFLYLFNVELFGLGNPVIIGGVDVKVDVECFTGGVADVDYVEFLVDGESKMQDFQSPFIWRLDEQLFGSHEIGVTVYSSDGETVSESVQATCLIF